MGVRVSSWVCLSSIGLWLLAWSAASFEHSGAPKVVSAADFMRSLHLQPPHRQQPPARLRAERGKDHSEEGELGESSTVGRLHNTRQLRRDLSKLQHLSSEPLHVKKEKPTRAQLKLDLQAATRHFPETEKQIAALQHKIQHHEAAERAASQLSAATHKKVQQKVAEMHKIEAKREYDLMTDPNAEKVADQAEESLQHLKSLADGYGKKADANSEHVKHLKKKLSEKLHERQINVKAVQLFHHFKKKYETELSGKVATMSTEFHDKAMAAALKLAKKKFHSFKSKFLAKQGDQVADKVRQLEKKVQRMKLRRKKRQELRAKRRAQAATQRDAKEKSEARLMFQKYVDRFHDMEQQESTRELQAELDMEDQSK